MRHILYIMCIAAVVTACNSGLKKENEALRAEIDERREALAQNNAAALAAERRALATADSLLAIVRSEHDAQHEWVMSHATQLSDTSQQVLRLNSLRARMDSLTVEFESHAEKVKLLMRMNEKDRK